MKRAELLRNPDYIPELMEINDKADKESKRGRSTKRGLPLS
jgi:hypothetical protein